MANHLLENVFAIYVEKVIQSAVVSEDTKGKNMDSLVQAFKDENLSGLNVQSVCRPLNLLQNSTVMQKNVWNKKNLKTFHAQAAT